MQFLNHPGHLGKSGWFGVGVNAVESADQECVDSGPAWQVAVKTGGEWADARHGLEERMMKDLKSYDSQGGF